MFIARTRVMIAGSVDPRGDPELARYAHALVAATVETLASAGANFVVMLGKEPRANFGGDELPIIFDWAVASCVAAALRSGAVAVADSCAPLLTISTQRLLTNLPESRKADWDKLRDAQAVEIRFIDAGWGSGAVRRARAADQADVLLAIGGGEGVEHLGYEFLRQRKPVIPLDLNVGASCNDGSGGAVRLWKDFLAAPQPCFVTAPGRHAQSLLAGVTCEGGKRPVPEVVRSLAVLLEALALPPAFYVRLLDRADTQFSLVETYFRGVVDPVIAELGFRAEEMGLTSASEPWINGQIFKTLHTCSLAVVDLTGMRPNCFIELGYALGRRRRTLVLANKGTKLPFDMNQYDTHFWTDPNNVTAERSDLLAHWKRVCLRPPLIAD